MFIMGLMVAWLFQIRIFFSFLYISSPCCLAWPRTPDLLPLPPELGITTDLIMPTSKMCVVCVCACSPACVHACEYTHTRRCVLVSMEATGQCHLSSSVPIHLILETAFLNEPGAQGFSEAVWPASFRSLLTATPGPSAEITEMLFSMLVYRIWICMR